MTGTKVTKIVPAADGLQVTFEGKRAATQTYEQVLMAVGRTPNGKRLSAEKAGITVDQRGFIPVDKQMRTNVPHIFAVGDIVGQPMLAHKANHEGQGGRGSRGRAQGGIRCTGHPLGGLHRSGNRLGGRDRERSEGGRHRLRQGPVSLGSQRPGARPQSRRGHDQAAVRQRPTG
jgi:hypothetical protein